MRIRLDKFLADSGVGSRSAVKQLIRGGHVSVNGELVTDEGMKTDTETDVISVDGKELGYEKYRYFVLNKPAGCVSATKDRLSDTVLDMLKGEDTRDLFPVGRLDKDTEGFLLITNDGPLAHNLLSPAKHVPKKYFAVLDRDISEEDALRIEDCIDIGDDKRCLPAKVEILKDKGAYITISEGRFHQVKRMFAAAGYEVMYLKRVSMGKLYLDEDLLPGQYKKLSEDELVLLTERE